MFNRSASSFNQMFESEPEVPDEIEDGLDNMLEEFTYKTQFL